MIQIVFHRAVHAEVGMTVDESWKKGRMGPVYHARVIGGEDLTGSAYRLNPPIFDEHSPARQRVVALAVPDISAYIDCFS